jgi:sugar fermentation stimulation protein A
MRFEAPLVEARLLRRWKRFFAEAELAGGERVIAHCANPGAMTGCMPIGAPVWLRPSADPRRRLAWTWELVRNGRALICVNTARGNQVVAEALAAGRIAELAGAGPPRREVALGSSRIDFGFGAGRQRTFLEVKTVTLDGGDGIAAFPDSVTARGTRHVGELARAARRGHRTVLLFCVARSGARAVRPADDIDPDYGRALRRAAAAGVELYAYGCRLSRTGIWLNAPLPVLLD